jgi:hypothetical protein
MGKNNLIMNEFIKSKDNFKNNIDKFDLVDNFTNPDFTFKLTTGGYEFFFKYQFISRCK